MLILKGHLYGKPVRSLAFAPDGTSLASAARDYKVRLWDLNTGKSVVAAGDEWCDAYWLAYAPDGKTLAWGGQCDVHVWTIGSEKLEYIATEWDGSPVRVQYSRDGSFLAAVSGTVRLWYLRTDESVPTYLTIRSGGSTNATSSLAFAPDGKTLATGHAAKMKGSYHHLIRLWDVDTRTERGTLSGHGGTATTLAFSPDGRTLVAACGTTLLAWDVASGEVLVNHKFNKQFCKDVAFTPDGRFLLIARNDNTIRVWNAQDWREHVAFDWNLGAMVSLAVAADGMRAAAGSDKGTIIVWDLDL